MKYSANLYKESEIALSCPKEFMGTESKELFGLYLELQATDGYFTELLEEELERKQLVLGILSCSSSWDSLARRLEEQSTQ